jgi:two-component system nitrate/nitrite sensor histidine kinase NarX
MIVNKDPDPIKLEKRERIYQSIFDSVNDGLVISDLESGQIIEINSAACKLHGYLRDELIGQDLSRFIQQDCLKEFNKCLKAFRSEGVFDTQVKHVRKDGYSFYVEWRGTKYLYLDRPCLLSVIRDVSSRILEEQSLRRTVETHNHEQATLLEISHNLASTLELQPGMILDQMREIIEYTNGGLFALEDSSMISLALRGSHLLEQSPPFHIHLNGPEVLPRLFNEHKPIRIDNLWSENTQAQFLRSLFLGDAALLLEGMHSWMWVPLAVRGRIIGGVGVADSRKNYFTAHDADLALRVANQAAIAMVNAELYGHAQALAVLEERQRLARNLHDAVNQSLFSAGLIAEVLPRLWDRDQEEARRALEDLRRLTRGAQAEMRALLAELRPTTLTDSDLGDLLRLLGNAHSGRTNVPVEVTILENITLPAQVQVAFYRVCQEALFNIAKHSKANQVEIILKQEGSMIELCIHDDGQGFDPDQTVSGHYGLKMMRERAEAVGAELVITSQPGKGTALTIRWSNIPKKEIL